MYPVSHSPVYLFTEHHLVYLTHSFTFSLVQLLSNLFIQSINYSLDHLVNTRLLVYSLTYTINQPIKRMKHLPKSQSIPCQPPVQSHVYSFWLLLHEAPLAHGLLKHSSMSETNNFTLTFQIRDVYFVQC